MKSMSYDEFRNLVQIAEEALVAELPGRSFAIVIGYNDELKKIGMSTTLSTPEAKIVLLSLLRQLTGKVN